MITVRPHSVQMRANPLLPTAFGAARRQAAGAAVVQMVAVTGGAGAAAALEEMLACLPDEFSALMLVSLSGSREGTAGLAERLGRVSPMRVAETRTGSLLGAGTVWLAGVDQTFYVARSAGVGRAALLTRSHGMQAVTHQGDSMLSAAAEVHGPGALALVLSGNAGDGVAGASAVRARGGTVLVQDEGSSAVWGTARRVIDTGLAHHVLTPRELASELVRRVCYAAAMAQVFQQGAFDGRR